MSYNYKELYEALLAEFEQYKKESIKWSVEDFTEYDQDEYTINDQQAQIALEDMIRHHDCNYGITWEHVNYFITVHGTPKTNDNE